MSVSDKLPSQKSNHLAEDEICEYIPNYESCDNVTISDELKNKNWRVDVYKRQESR